MTVMCGRLKDKQGTAKASKHTAGTQRGLRPLEMVFLPLSSLWCGHFGEILLKEGFVFISAIWQVQYQRLSK